MSVVVFCTSFILKHSYVCCVPGMRSSFDCSNLVCVVAEDCSKDHIDPH